MDKLIDSFKPPQLKEDTDNFNRLVDNKEIERVIGSLSRKEEKKKGRQKEGKKEGKQNKKEGRKMERKNERNKRQGIDGLTTFDQTLKSNL